MSLKTRHIQPILLEIHMIFYAMIRSDYSQRAA